MKTCPCGERLPDLVHHEPGDELLCVRCSTRYVATWTVLAGARVFTWMATAEYNA